MGEKYNPSNLLIKGYRFIKSKKKYKKSKSQPEETIAERVKLKNQYADDDKSSLEVDDSDKSIYIPDMALPEGHQEEVKEEKG